MYTERCVLIPMWTMTCSDAVDVLVPTSVLLTMYVVKEQSQGGTFGDQVRSSRQEDKRRLGLAQERRICHFHPKGRRSRSSEKGRSTPSASVFPEPIGVLPGLFRSSSFLRLFALLVVADRALSLPPPYRKSVRLAAPEIRPELLPLLYTPSTARPIHYTLAPRYPPLPCSPCIPSLTTSARGRHCARMSALLCMSHHDTSSPLCAGRLPSNVDRPSSSASMRTSTAIEPITRESDHVTTAMNPR